MQSYLYLSPYFLTLNGYETIKIPRSPPALPPILTRRPGLRKRAHPFTLPLKDDNQCIPCVLYRALLPPVQSQVCFLYIYLHSFHNNYLNLALSLHLVLLAPVNSCELHNYYLVLSFLLMYSSSSLSTDVFFLIKRI